MIFEIEGIEIQIGREGSAVRVVSEVYNVVLPDQTIRVTERLIKENYRTVSDHYKKRSRGQVNPGDLTWVSLKIVFHYLYIYNRWRGLYEKEKGRDLRFTEKDLNHPQTYDIIVNYFKERDKTNYVHPCCLLMDMDTREFHEYEMGRQCFFDRR